MTENAGARRGRPSRRMRRRADEVMGLLERTAPRNAAGRGRARHAAGIPAAALALGALTVGGAGVIVGLEPPTDLAVASPNLPVGSVPTDGEGPHDPDTLTASTLDVWGHGLVGAPAPAAVHLPAPLSAGTPPPVAPDRGATAQPTTRLTTPPTAPTAPTTSPSGPTTPSGPTAPPTPSGPTTTPADEEPHDAPDAPDEDLVDPDGDPEGTGDTGETDTGREPVAERATERSEATDAGGSADE